MTVPAAALTPDPRALRALHRVPGVDVARNLRLARAHGLRYSAVLTELMALAGGPGKLSPQEYFYYRLWDRTLSLAAKRQFLGRAHSSALHNACNDEASRPVADDKLLFHAAMRTGGFPVPELVAVAHASRGCDGAVALANAAQVRAFFERAAYPLFGKPIDGVFSMGVFQADGYDAHTGTLVLHGRAPLPIAACADQLARYAPGYLLQRVLRPHAEIARRFGDRLWSIRLVILLTRRGPVIARAAAKIPAGANIADNFWRPGNLLGGVDVAQGTVVRTVRGTGSEMRIDEPHPDTLVPLSGFVVPDWEEVAALALRAAATLPGIRTQSWDVALTDRGPVLLEVNYGGDLNLVQLASGRGMLDDAYREHLASCGVRV